jgi:homoserine kinase
MPNPSTVTISVPATTANLGPGFDCLGAALTLHNHFTFSLTTNDASPITITAVGEEADRVQTDTTNLAYQSFLQLYQTIQQPVPAVQIDIQLGVPLARGLGSSATAIVAGLVGANVLTGSLLTPEEVMQQAIAMEGHPDNVVPALLGGCRLAATNLDGGWEICEIPWHTDVAAVVAIPNFELSTAEARRVLPDRYSRADAIFNAAHLGLLVRGLETGEASWLRAALQDRIHQPYRYSLVAGYKSVQTAALEAGAYGLVISGAGPTLLALTAIAQAATVRAAIATAWASEGITATVQVLHIDHQGAAVSSESDTISA